MLLREVPCLREPFGQRLIMVWRATRWAPGDRQNVIPKLLDEGVVGQQMLGCLRGAGVEYTASVMRPHFPS